MIQSLGAHILIMHTHDSNNKKCTKTNMISLTSQNKELIVHRIIQNYTNKKHRKTWK